MNNYFHQVRKAENILRSFSKQVQLKMGERVRTSEIEAEKCKKKHFLNI